MRKLAWFASGVTLPALAAYLLRIPGAGIGQMADQMALLAAIWNIAVLQVYFYLGSPPESK